MILQTNLEHVADSEQYEKALKDNENLMICCGRMGPMCIPVYQSMIELGSAYPQVAFRDMAFDAPVAQMIRSLPECRRFMGLPFNIYFRNRKVVAATSGIQTKAQIQGILDREFA